MDTDGSLTAAPSASVSDADVMDPDPSYDMSTPTDKRIEVISDTDDMPIPRYVFNLFLAYYADRLDEFMAVRGAMDLTCPPMVLRVRLRCRLRAWESLKAPPNG
jgi:hypothetical protein